MSDTHVAVKALSQALKFEQEGRAFYLKAAEMATDDRGREMFLSLADDERMHMEMIQRQLHAVEGDGAYVLLPDLNVPDIDLGHKLFPPDQKAIEAKVGVEPSELDALALALENEIKSYDFYVGAAQSETDEAGRQMYTWLANAEMTHFDLLMNNWNALAGQAGFV